jgi:hypothetical protein
MKIGISINGIIRDLLTKIKSVYEKYYDKEISNPLTIDNLQEELDFKTNDDLIDFLYREAPMEIFGHAKEVDDNFIRNLNSLVMDNKNHTFTILSDDVGRAIPATLWFLAKYGCMVKNIKFYTRDTVDMLWDDFDLIFTNDEPIINSRPKDKLLYTFNGLNEVSSSYVLESPNKIINLEIFQTEDVERT